MLSCSYEMKLGIGFKGCFCATPCAPVQCNGSADYSSLRFLRNCNSYSPLLMAPALLGLGYQITEYFHYLVNKLVFNQHTERWARPKIKYGSLTLTKISHVGHLKLLSANGPVGLSLM